jgi:phosphoribosylformylglycinamidine synthase
MKGRFMIEARIHVTLKKSVLDPQGDTVRSGLASLGFTTVQDCRVGKFMVLRLNETDADAAKVRVDEMCRRLLANPVIEDYVFQVNEVAG